jgi:uncharacterized protein (TIGR00299 family) protein
VIAYFDCFSGISGDMVLGALIDAGADLEAVRKQVGQIDIGPVEITAAEVVKAGIRATKIEITGGREKPAGTLAEATRLLRESSVDETILNAALGTVGLLAAAEARVHGSSTDQVHFHEIDAVDTIVDIVGAATALTSLGISEVKSSPVATGYGSIETSHGLYPVPAPAVVELLRDRPFYGGTVKAELATPTGSAILAYWATSFGDLPRMTVRSVGYGAGTAEFESVPNVLRVFVGEPIESELRPVDDLVVEATIDDMNPEIYTYVSERLFDAGAEDVWMVPAIGKRGRPATVLTVMVPPNLLSAISDVIVTETSTIGLRATPVQKLALPRLTIEVRVEGVTIRVKVAERVGKVVNSAPEYRDCAEAARITGLPLKEIYRRAIAAADAQLGGRRRS